MAFLVIKLADCCAVMFFHIKELYLQFSVALVGPRKVTHGTQVCVPGWFFPVLQALFSLLGLKTTASFIFSYENNVLLIIKVIIQRVQKGQPHSIKAEPEPETAEKALPSTQSWDEDLYQLGDPFIYRAAGHAA